MSEASKQSSEPDVRPQLRDLLDWVIRMPDALLGPEDPRWEWWNDGIWVRQAARNALASIQDSESP